MATYEKPCSNSQVALITDHVVSQAKQLSEHVCEMDAPSLDSAYTRRGFKGLQSAGPVDTNVTSGRKISEQLIERGAHLGYIAVPGHGRRAGFLARTWL